MNIFLKGILWTSSKISPFSRIGKKVGKNNPLSFMKMIITDLTYEHLAKFMPITCIRIAKASCLGFITNMAIEFMKNIRILKPLKINDKNSLSFNLIIPTNQKRRHSQIYQNNAILFIISLQLGLEQRSRESIVRTFWYRKKHKIINKCVNKNQYFKYLFDDLVSNKGEENLRDWEETIELQKDEFVEIDEPSYARE